MEGANEKILQRGEIVLKASTEIEIPEPVPESIIAKVPKYERIVHGHPRWKIQMKPCVTNVHGTPKEFVGQVVVKGDNGKEFPIFAVNHYAWEDSCMYLWPVSSKHEYSDQLITKWVATFPIGTKLSFATASIVKHKLQTKWSLWESRRTARAGNTAASSEDAAFLSKNVELCSFEYVEDFWSYWNNMPQPSRAFESIDFNLNGYALFKHGMQPNPKDPKFSSGGMYFCEANIAPHHLDEFWMSLVLSLIGETLEKEEDIVGARVVDVSPDLREKLFRIELWFEVNDESAKRPALENMVSLLAGHGLKKLPLPDFSWAPISTTA